MNKAKIYNAGLAFGLDDADRRLRRCGFKIYGSLEDMKKRNGGFLDIPKNLKGRNIVCYQKKRILDTDSSDIGFVKGYLWYDLNNGDIIIGSDSGLKGKVFNKIAKKLKLYPKEASDRKE